MLFLYEFTFFFPFVGIVSFPNRYGIFNKEYSCFYDQSVINLFNK